MKPAGDMDLMRHTAFYTMADYAFSAGARIFHLETCDLYEMKVAVLAERLMSRGKQSLQYMQPWRLRKTEGPNGQHT